MVEGIVFAGPCLSRLDDARRAALLPSGFELRPPARRGDVLAALADDPGTIVLLDGYFFQDLSVAHQELVLALEAGVRVIGAASMGALRAVELAPLGMLGVGRIYDWFAGGALEGDDEVTVLHFPAEEGYRLLTVALVELRHALAQLVEAAEVDETTATRLIAAVQARAFSDRSPELVAALAREHLGEAGAEALLERLDAFHLKESDALRALELAATPRAPRSSEAPPPADARSIFLNYWCEDHLRPGDDTTLMRAWNVAQLFHDEAVDFVRRLRLRVLAASAVERAGLDVPARHVRERERDLAGFVEAHHAGRPLPPHELAREARLQAACELACESFGGPEHAGDWLAAEYGLDAERGHAELLERLALQYGLQSSWSLVRGFVFTHAFGPALELANAADEVSRYFQSWSEGARIGRDDLVHLAAELWDCAPEAVLAEGSRRGLLESHGFSEGLREVLQRVAPAERLPRPINAYAERKATLQAQPLAYALELFPAVGRERSFLQPRRRPTRFTILGS